jgi:hypothetical protein
MQYIFVPVIEHSPKRRGTRLQKKLSLLVRQIAIETNILLQIYNFFKTNLTCNWVIAVIKIKISSERESPTGQPVSLGADFFINKLDK